MIKEYINKLLAENKETLKQLEKQLGDLLNELTSAEQWAESLQRESNAQTNIFSPRNIDVEIGQKIEKASNSISNINQQIEYVRDLIETHLRKQSEYEELMIEIDNMEYSNNSSDTNKTKTVSDEYFLNVLSELYSKVELCLALLNSDKNKCKHELNNMRYSMKKYAEEIKNNEE